MLLVSLLVSFYLFDIKTVFIIRLFLVLKKRRFGRIAENDIVFFCDKYRTVFGFFDLACFFHRMKQGSNHSDV